MPLRGVSYRTPTRRADHLFRSGEGRGVRRTTLHYALAARVEELGITRLTARVEAVSQTDTSVAAAGVTARYLLACDGLHSTVRRLTGLERTVRGRRRFGLRRHYAIAPWNDLIEVHWTRDAEVYVTPLTAELTGIAVLGPPHTDFASTVGGVPELGERLAGAEADRGARGWAVPPARVGAHGRPGVAGRGRVGLRRCDHRRGTAPGVRTGPGGGAGGSR